MKGIYFVIDDKGRKVAVQIDLRAHKGLWEYLQHFMASRSHRHKKSTPLDPVKSDRIKHVRADRRKDRESIESVAR